MTTFVQGAARSLGLLLAGAALSSCMAHGGPACVGGQDSGFGARIRRFSAWISDKSTAWEARAARFGVGRYPDTPEFEPRSA